MLKRRKRSKGFLTKVRYPTYSRQNVFTNGGGKLLIRTCERCRRKDGLGLYRTIYGICSFCGRKGRMYMGPLESHIPTVKYNPKVPYRWRWIREGYLDV